jgi:hypothetical protein
MVSNIPIMMKYMYMYSICICVYVYTVATLNIEPYCKMTELSGVFRKLTLLLIAALLK